MEDLRAAGRRAGKEEGWEGRRNGRATEVLRGNERV